MSSTRTFALLSLGLASIAHFASAQSLVGASEASGRTTSNLVIIDPATGASTIYMTFPVTAGYELYYLTTLPNCGGLVGGLYLANNTSTSPSFFAKLDLAAATATYTPFGAPLNTSYSEAVEYSPRHNALLVSFTNFGSFGTNRLALVSPINGSVISTSSALSGISDIDHIASSATEDYLVDLNAASATQRLKRMVNLLPTPTFASAGSYPNSPDFQDSALHPTTGQFIFADAAGTILKEIGSNTYTTLASLQGGLVVQGLTWATLPPRINSATSTGICSARTASATAIAVGTPPITAHWQVEHPYASGQYIDLSGSSFADVTNGRSFTFTDPTLNTIELSGILLGTATEIKLRRNASNTCGIFNAPISIKPCPADFNCDGFVDDFDFAVFAEAYELFSVPPANASADFNADGFVDDFDFTLFAAAYEDFNCP